MKQKLGTRPYGHYVWGGRRKNAGVSNWSGSPCVGFSSSHVSFLFSVPLSSNGPSDSHSGRAPTTHIMDPYTANHQAAQGRKVARGKKNLACQILHSRLPRFPRLGLSDLTTRLSTHSGDRYQVNCVRSSSCVSITATSEISLSLSSTPHPRSKVDSPNPGKF